jgi:hypothetical protein
MSKQINKPGLSPTLVSKFQAGGSMMSSGNKNIKGEFVSKLLHSTMQAHMYHLMSPSYAQHMALGGFYDDMPDLADDIAETLMGTDGKLTGYSSTMTFDTSYNPVGFLNGLRHDIVSMRESVSNKTNFMNQTDAILDLIDSTLYKLKELK